MGPTILGAASYSLIVILPITEDRVAGGSRVTEMFAQIDSNGPVLEGMNLGQRKYIYYY